MINTETMKSTVVFAPAGSGKTEELSKRFLDLIEAGVKPERILTLTFTEKAAVEMKERILTNARKRNLELYRNLRENILKLRISTIHSFCLSLLQRFADLLDIDPHPEVLQDDITLWQQAKYDTLMDIAEKKDFEGTRVLLISLLGDQHQQNWQKISRLFDKLFHKRNVLVRSNVPPKNLVPIPEVKDLAQRLCKNRIGYTLMNNYRQLFVENYDDENEIQRIADLLSANATNFMTVNGTPKKQGYNQEQQLWAEQMVQYRNQIVTISNLLSFKKKLMIFTNCFLRTFEQMKREKGMVDYDDMELLALRLLRENPDWLNILYIFDEHTDHILVDEFQDTSFLQWAIIEKLIEEWLSGEGIKSELGITPTVFIVGDDKQSIYGFREAKVEVFSLARDKLLTWLGEEKLEIHQLENNYRSLPAIIDFNNELFSRLMNPEPDAPPWFTRYRPFLCQRRNSGAGRVELLIDKIDETLNLPTAREREAKNIACRIRMLLESGFVIYERQPDNSEIPRPCNYRDIAILIRARNDLLYALEKKLREYSIPFLVVGGTGFYEETEVRYLSYLTKCIIDPADDVALYITLRGVLFRIPERELLLSIIKTGSDHSSLWERLRNSVNDQNRPLSKALKIIEDAQRGVNYEPLHIILNRLLIKIEAWKVFWEPQREANVRKFLQRIQELELGGRHPFRIHAFLDQARTDEPKADVPTEGMNAVQIMTVHAAKGLQFPIVFHPGLHEKIVSRKTLEDLLVEETAINNVRLLHIEDKIARRSCAAYLEYEEKQIEEEKRIFYVACTRARDALFLTGIWNENLIRGSKLNWLTEHLGLHTNDYGGFSIQVKIDGVECTSAAELQNIKPEIRTRLEKQQILIKHKISSSSKPPLQPIVRFLPAELSENDYEALGIGETLHRILELISKGWLQPDPATIDQGIDRELRIRGFLHPRRPQLKQEIKNHINQLINSSLWEIIQPQPNSFAELPIMFNDGATFLTGRIDRVIVTPEEVRGYDYKTFPVNKTEIKELIAEYYESQLKYYAAALQELFPGKKVKIFIIFTQTGQIEPAIQ